MNLSCYILDDEFHAIEIIKKFIAKTPGLKLAGFSDQPLAALEEIAFLAPDLTFLDVDMPDLNGLQFAGMVNSQTIIVFVTAYREYAPEAFEKEAVDYLLKPISYERFLACVQRIRKNLIPKQQQPRDFLEESFFVTTGINGKMVRVNFGNLRYISGADHYIELHLQQQKLVVYLTFSEILEKLPPRRFSRIHKSYIVNHAFIHTLEPGQLKLTDLTVLPIGRVYRSAFRQKISDSFLTSKWDHTE